MNDTEYAKKKALLDAAIAHRDSASHESHEEYTREEWKDDVQAGDTQLGYWDWVIHNLESHEEAEHDSFI
jgi:hypothetical protein